ncbi:hypothetical protein ACH5RR_009716 [Cinchona calisaya]|uniref:RNA helicase n=1 Tax=Cinchona calisaya TaxID=153742 RepID=A0ABD3AFI1_9GENT
MAPGTGTGTGTTSSPSKVLVNGTSSVMAKGGMINRCNWRPHWQRRKSLPIWQHKDEFLKSLNQNQTLILVGETATCKTTQIPQFVLETVDTKMNLEEDTQGRKYMIGCTLPHREAAIAAALRVAEEMDLTLGDEVGYTVEFEDCSSAATVLNYLTDGMLLREAMADPLLERYGVIILDETHKRTLQTDVLFGFLKDVLKKRSDLKLVIMSGTRQAVDEKFQHYFCGAPIMEIPAARIHPVEIFYMSESMHYFDAAIQAVVQIHMDYPPGDVLVFLTGAEEIEEACRTISWKICNLGDDVGPVKVVPLYSMLPRAMLQTVLEPAPRVENGPAGRKIVVSTDIAETSLSIDGIVYVVDPGYINRKFYYHKIGAEFEFTGTSKASAQNRSRCAGREQPGKCFRLFCKDDFLNDLQPHKKPEILQSNMAYTVLTLKKLGIGDLFQFDFMDPPDPEALVRALEVLKRLGALDDDGNITELGKIISEFPLDPQMAKTVIVSPEFNCSNEILSIAAMLSVPNCFVCPIGARIAADEARARFAHRDGDHLTLLNVYHAYNQNNEDPQWCYENFINHGALKAAENVREQLSRIMVRLGLKLCSTDFNSPDYDINIRKAMLAGYFMQVAHLDFPGRYTTLNDSKMVQLHPLNGLDHEPEWVIFHKYVLDTWIFISTVTAVRGEWLVDLMPQYVDLANFSDCEAKHLLKILYENL